LVVYIIYINDSWSSKYQIMKCICSLNIKKRSLESSETPVLYRVGTVPKVNIIYDSMLSKLFIKYTNVF